MLKPIEIIFPKSAAIHRAFGAVWILTSGQIAIALTLLPSTANAKAAFLCVWMAAFLTALICSHYFGTLLATGDRIQLEQSW